MLGAKSIPGVATGDYTFSVGIHVPILNIKTPCSVSNKRTTEREGQGLSNDRSPCSGVKMNATRLSHSQEIQKQNERGNVLRNLHEGHRWRKDRQ